MSRRFAGVTIRTWWTLVIACSVSSLGTWAAIDHSNANRDRQQAQSNAQFRQATILSNRKFQQAIRISSRESSYSLNKIVCGFRGFIGPTLKSYEAAAKDPTLSNSARLRNDKRIRTTRAYLDTLVAVPADFDCKTLPKKPPSPVAPPKATKGSP